jgi:hypothetical protein
MDEAPHRPRHTLDAARDPWTDRRALSVPHRGVREHGDGPGPGDNDIVRDSLVGVYLAQFAVVTFGVLAITSEHATGMIHTTFTAMPRRGRVLLAKALLVGGTVLALALASSLTAFFVGQRLLRDNGYAPPAYPEWTLQDGPAQRAVFGSALLLTAIALLSLGVGAPFNRRWRARTLSRSAPGRDSVSQPPGQPARCSSLSS